MEPAVIGSKNVIVAAAEAKVRRVVFTSSIGAVYMDPNRSPDELIDETYWSDLDFCKNIKVLILYYSVANIKMFMLLLDSRTSNPDQSLLRKYAELVLLWKSVGRTNGMERVEIERTRHGVNHPGVGNWPVVATLYQC